MNSGSPLEQMALLKLMQLCSASLPIGAYAFSQGLEFAIESDQVKGESGLVSWLQQLLYESLVHTDMPILVRQLDAFAKGDNEAAVYWNSYALACRETKELYTTDTATGEALVRLLDKLGLLARADHRREKQAGENHKADTSFITAFAYAAVHWQIDQQSALLGFCWAWLENQVAAASKLVPLGQSQAQAVIAELQPDIPVAVARALEVQDEQIGSGLPGVVMASCRHETQYTRLFRS